MRNITLLAAFLIIFIGFVEAGEQIDPKDISPEVVLKAIKLLEADPIEANTAGTNALIIIFTTASSDVIAEISSDYLPWLKQKKNIENADILLTAFIAGNIKPQLIKKIKKDHPFEGVKFMLNIYAKLRKDNKIQAIPKLDEWNKLEDDDLKKIIGEIKAKIQ